MRARAGAAAGEPARVRVPVRADRHCVADGAGSEPARRGIWCADRGAERQPLLGARREGEPVDPLDGTGAHYAWIAIPTACFDRQQLVDQRGAIQDAIDAGLDCGRVIGATVGEQEVCIDVVLFDHPRGVSQLKRVLGEIERVKSATLRRFAASKAKVVLE